MRSVPHFLSGAFRAAYRVALHETVRGCEEREGTRQIRGLEVVHACAEDVVAPPAMRRFGPKGRLEERFRRFADGQWVDVVNESSLGAGRASVTTSRRRLRERQDDLERRPPGLYIRCMWARCP